MVKISSIPAHTIERHIHTIGGQKVLLDEDLAELYGVPTKALLQTFRRNAERFPEDFVFRLTAEEYASLRSQSVTSKKGGRRYLPYAFTEQGVAMLSSILRSKTAVSVNIAIMRAFVRLRRSFHDHKDLVRTLEHLEKTVAGHDKHIATIFEAIRRMIGPTEPNRRSSYPFNRRKKDGNSRRVGWISSSEVRSRNSSIRNFRVS